MAVVVILVAALAGVGWYALRSGNHSVSADTGGHSPSPTGDGRPAWVPSDWTVAVRALAAGWHDHRSSNGTGTCSMGSSQLTVTLTDPVGTGMFQCVGRPTVYGDVAINTTVRVDSGCAGLWLRTGDTQGYFLDRCHGSIELHLVSDTDPSAASLMKRWPGTGERIGAMVRGDVISVYADGHRLGSVRNGQVDAGRVDLGVFTGQDDSARVVFSRARVWQPPA